MESFSNIIKKIKTEKRVLNKDIDCLLRFIGIFLSKSSGIRDKINALQNTWLENRELSYNYINTVSITIISENETENKQFFGIKDEVCRNYEQYFIICEKNNIKVLASCYTNDYRYLKSKKLLHKPRDCYIENFETRGKVISFESIEERYHEKLMEETISKVTKFGTFFALKTEFKNVWTILKFVLRNFEICIFNSGAFENIFDKFFVDTILGQNKYFRLLDYFC